MAHQSWVEAPDGVRLAVYEWGNPDGPEILLIHGSAQSHLSFTKQIHSDLAQHYRLLAYDLRGHGLSDKPLDPALYHDSRMWADDLATVIGAVCRGRPLVAGWSLGGRVIRAHLIHHGDARLAGINFVSSRVVEDPSVAGPGSPSQRGASVEGLDSQIAVAIAFLEACFHHQPSEPDFRVALGYNMLVPFPVRQALAQWSTDPALTVAALGRVTVPVLITQGQTDRIVLPRAAELIAQAVPHARISWYDDCGHSPFHEHAARFNSELTAFAAEVFAAPLH